MKGGLAAQCAVAIALRKAGLRPGGDLIVESVVDEEFAGGGGTLAGRLRGDHRRRLRDRRAHERGGPARLARRPLLRRRLPRRRPERLLLEGRGA